MRIGYIVDHPKRDLPGGIMFSLALAARGVETALVPLYEQALDVPLLGLDGLVVNFARPVNLELVRTYAVSGLPVWVIDTEGGVLTHNGANSPNALARYVRDSGFGDLLAGYLFWGSVLREAFIEGSGMDPGRLHLTGCPRFDYAAPRWRALLDRPRRDYVLVNANFSLVNPLFARSPDEEIRTVVASGWEEGYVRQLLVDQHQIFEGFTQTLDRLFVAMPGQHFLLRPHPFESAAFYRDRYRDRANVTVDGSGSVLNVIRNAKAVLHLNCGTAIEAVLLDTLPLSMEFLNTDFMRRHGRLPSNVSVSVHSFEFLVETISNLEKTALDFPFSQRHREFIEPWFHLNDGHAADRVAEVVVTYLGAHSAKPAGVSVGRSIQSSRPRARVGQLLQGLTANVLGSRRTAMLRSRFQTNRREKLFDLAHIREEALNGCALAGLASLKAGWAPHPWTGFALASVLISP
jgi:surface carbohydrate biosynthesis protein